MIRAFALALALSAVAGITTAATEIKPQKLATGELLVHAYKNGMPLPAESKWMLATGAGPSFFPEGGRSMTGEILEFKPIIGYLALTCRIGILPM